MLHLGFLNTPQKIHAFPNNDNPFHPSHRVKHQGNTPKHRSSRFGKSAFAKKLLAFQIPTLNRKKEQLFLLRLDVYSVFTSLPYTVSQKDLSKYILISIKRPAGVKVFRGFLGDTGRGP